MSKHLHKIISLDPHSYSNVIHKISRGACSWCGFPTINFSNMNPTSDCYWGRGGKTSWKAIKVQKISNPLKRDQSTKGNKNIVASRCRTSILLTLSTVFPQVQDQEVIIKICNEDSWLSMCRKRNSLPFPAIRETRIRFYIE